MTDARCRREILARGHDLNPMKGVAGEFYRENRKEDLRQLCLEVLNQKEKYEKT